MASADDDDDFSDDSSDDEFLTHTDAGNSQDREALIRRKLMESFYGKSLPTEDSKPAADDADSDDDDDDNGGGGDDELKQAAQSSIQEKDEEEEDDIQTTSDDLDSPYFDPDAHTSKYVLQANVHDVLEVEERLALQVRTLDSTMQTLVYENYSKFIDATDAIRSIGVSVHANEEGLGRLSRGMHIIDEQSRSVEDALGTLRDAVAEKLRIKRLLTRLDALLKLPATLKQQIVNGQYRLATKSYLSAHAILSKHSAGFESLKTIELDCHSILTDMVKTLKHKLLHWSGQASGIVHLDSMGDESELDQDGESKGTEDAEKDQPEKGDEGWIPPPEHPKSVSDIFECASTLLIVLPKAGEEEEEDTGVTFDAGITASECKAAALAAAIRYLERVLDSHQIELQDAMFNTGGFAEDAFESTLAPATELDASHPSLAPKESNLIPTDYLDSVLEATTLFGISFSIDGAPSLNDGDRSLLMEFVNEAFAAFLIYVRSLLLERSLDEDSDDEEDAEKEVMMEGESNDGDEAYSEISAAMTHLLRAVRDLASGLALPDVGIDVDFASGLVEQAVVVTETMVRRRVAQKFINLRCSVVLECLAPFAKDAIAHVSESESARVVEIVQMASVALSDGLQLVDDTVKSILTGGVVVSDLKGVDYAMVKEAVQGCCRRFAMWLATTLEILAGCESSDRNVTIEAAEIVEELTEESNEDSAMQGASDTHMATREDDMSEMQEENLNEKVDSSLDELLLELEKSSTAKTHSDLILAISEMCRLAQRSVMENISQSINSTASGGRKHNRNSDIFASSGPSAKMNRLSEQDCKASERFMLAASRVLTLYAMNRGADAALFACKKFHVFANEDGEDLPASPRSAMINVLQVAKETSIDCANVFGGEKFAGPVPDAPPDEMDAFNTGGSPYKSKSLTGLSAIKGLSLDVERMFTEKVPTFPHPSRIVDFSRNSVVFIVLKVAFNALVEQVRTCTFQTKGYRQLQVDAILLRYLLPHYVKDDVHEEGTNAKTILENVLNDVMANAGARCKDFDCVGQDKVYNPMTGETTTLQSIVRDFMSDKEETVADEESEEKAEHVKTKFIICEEGVE
eukprot:CAMPEP_0119005550 /NCGR_PEP_ID=MMETSP1176-20130426/1791_1 /TAXON_ID=265551 /ORGANISM="Synedropsis recta cf, Strain CCMP1620" /LENGTH=1090 /DNA_ID=CAMNT_0006957377 /DNA_START=16 /DNA_END=3288 /DNA_ORIENTATION=+